LRTTLVGFQERNANGHTSGLKPRVGWAKRINGRDERCGYEANDDNKNESTLVIAEKHRLGDSGESGVECNGANIASQNVGGATLPLVGTSTVDSAVAVDSIV
jgi:hypothetical protein